MKFVTIIDMETIKNIEIKTNARFYVNKTYSNNEVDYIDVVLECEFTAQGVEFASNKYTYSIQVYEGADINKQIQLTALYYAQLKQLQPFFSKEQIIKCVTDHLKKALK
jgi:hypothetical protein